jgi:hypothetical protein
LAGAGFGNGAPPLHDVVIADDALVNAAADAAEMFGSHAPSLFRFSRSAAEAAVVSRAGSAAGHRWRWRDRWRPRGGVHWQGDLEKYPTALDAALGLGAVGGNVDDAGLRKSATELGRLTFSRKSSLRRPVVIVTHEDTVLVPIEAERDAVAAQQAAEQAEIAAGIFGGEELGGENFARGFIEKAQESELPPRLRADACSSA